MFDTKNRILVRYVKMGMENDYASTRKFSQGEFTRLFHWPQTFQGLERSVGMNS